jgi:hypothetical protein
LFEKETLAPLTLGAGAFSAAVSQVTQSTPLYGREVWPAYPKRFGSAVGDIVSQNLFGDFLLASAFHEPSTGSKSAAFPGLLAVFFFLLFPAFTRFSSAFLEFPAGCGSGFLGVFCDFVSSFANFERR